MAGNLRTREWSGSTGAVCGTETEAFVRPRRPLNAGCADARIERGEHGRYSGLKKMTWKLSCDVNRRNVGLRGAKRPGC